MSSGYILTVLSTILLTLVISIKAFPQGNRQRLYDALSSLYGQDVRNGDVQSVPIQPNWDEVPIIEQLRENPNQEREYFQSFNDEPRRLTIRSGGYPYARELFRYFPNGASLLPQTQGHVIWKKGKNQFLLDKINRDGGAYNVGGGNYAALR